MCKHVVSGQTKSDRTYHVHLHHREGQHVMLLRSTPCGFESRNCGNSLKYSFVENIRGNYLTVVVHCIDDKRNEKTDWKKTTRIKYDSDISWRPSDVKKSPTQRGQSILEIRGHWIKPQSYLSVERGAECLQRRARVGSESKVLNCYQTDALPTSTRDYLQTSGGWFVDGVLACSPSGNLRVLHKAIAYRSHPEGTATVILL